MVSSLSAGPASASVQNWRIPSVPGPNGNACFGSKAVVPEWVLTLDLVAIAPGLPQMAEGRVGRAVQAVGRNGLAVFAAGSLWSAIGQAALGAALPYTTVGIERLAGLAYTLAGVAALFVFSRWIECRKTSVTANRPVFRSAAPQPL